MACVFSLTEVCFIQQKSFIFIHTNRPCFAFDFCFGVLRISSSWQCHEHIHLDFYNIMVLLFIIRSTINLDIYLYILYDLFFSKPSIKESSLASHELNYHFYNVLSFHIHDLSLSPLVFFSSHVPVPQYRTKVILKEVTNKKVWRIPAETQIY